MPVPVQMVNAAPGDNDLKNRLMNYQHDPCMARRNFRASLTLNSSVITAHMKNSGRANDPNRDQRVTDAVRFLDDRRREASAMAALWLRSTKPCADDELKYWRGVLRDIDKQAARLEERRQ